MNQPLLLDTCAALWVVAGEISEATTNALNEARSQGHLVYVSPIIAWEIGNLARKGRFKSHYSPQRWFEVLMSKPDTALAELTPRILMESWFPPGLFASRSSGSDHRSDCPRIRVHGDHPRSRAAPLRRPGALGCNRMLTARQTRAISRIFCGIVPRRPPSPEALFCARKSSRARFRGLRGRQLFAPRKRLIQG